MALGLFLAPISSIYAQSASAAIDGLEISPALVEVGAVKAKSYSVELKVRNVTKSDLVFDSTVNDFGAKDETGAANIILDVNSDLPTSIKSWVSKIPSFDLNAGEIKSFKVDISVPASAEPGGHYGVIRFAGRSPGVSTNIGQVASAGTLLLIRVDGKINEQIDLASFDVTKNGGNTSALFESGPLDFVTRFKNTGSVHEKPVGQIEVRDGFGHTVAVVPLNKDAGNVLPGSIRRFESPLNTGWMFGHYTADLSAGYGTTGQAIVRTISFWVIPYKLVLLALVSVATLFYILRSIMRRYNKLIITQSHKKR